MGKKVLASVRCKVCGRDVIARDGICMQCLLPIAMTKKQYVRWCHECLTKSHADILSGWYAKTPKMEDEMLCRYISLVRRKAATGSSFQKEITHYRNLGRFDYADALARYVTEMESRIEKLAK